MSVHPTDADEGIKTISQDDFLVASDGSTQSSLNPVVKEPAEAIAKYHAKAYLHRYVRYMGDGKKHPWQCTTQKKKHFSSEDEVQYWIFSGKFDNVCKSLMKNVPKFLKAVKEKKEIGGLLGGDTETLAQFKDMVEEGKLLENCNCWLLNFYKRKGRCSDSFDEKAFRELFAIPWMKECCLKALKETLGRLSPPAFFRRIHRKTPYSSNEVRLSQDKADVMEMLTQLLFQALTPYSTSTPNTLSPADVEEGLKRYRIAARKLKGKNRTNTNSTLEDCDVKSTPTPTTSPELIDDTRTKRRTDGKGEPSTQKRKPTTPESSQNQASRTVLQEHPVIERALRYHFAPFQIDSQHAAK